MYENDDAARRGNSNINRKWQWYASRFSTDPDALGYIRFVLVNRSRSEGFAGSLLSVATATTLWNAHFVSDSNEELIFNAHKRQRSRQCSLEFLPLASNRDPLIPSE